jgi:hypothetical protein
MIASRMTAAAETGRALSVLVHQPGQEFLVERAPVDADADRLVVFHRDFDDLRELGVALGLEADIAGVDPVLVERARAVGIVGQELVADIVEIADQRHGDADALQPFA